MIETLEQLDVILALVEYQNWRFYAEHMGNGFYVQARFPAMDPTQRRLEEQRGRKWYISRHATRAEVVQTCLKAVLTALEHEAREGFTYRGVALFQPHVDLDRLVEHAEAKVLRALQPGPLRLESSDVFWMDQAVRCEPRLDVSGHEMLDP